MPALNSMNIASPAAITARVLSVWCTTTLSITTWVKTGVDRPINWMKSDANSTSRQMRLWRRSSVANQRKPKPPLAAAPSPSGSRAFSWRTSRARSWNFSASSASGRVSGLWLPAGK